MIGNILMHPLAFAGGNHYSLPAAITSDSIIVYEQVPPQSC
jgi:hypothetical protein